jgi:transposase InsO family protein
LVRLYPVVGISKQGYHQWLNRELKRKEEQMQLMPIIIQIRKDHPMLSCREIYYKLKPKYMGRDRFEEFCFSYDLRVVKERNRYKTTDSYGVLRFPNLLLELDELTGVNQLWVSDITYFTINDQVYYLTFVLDIYNRKIVGFSASKTLRTTETTLKALSMAIKAQNLDEQSGTIIHSDGGGQYYSKQFKKLTKDFGMRNSMGKTAYENPHAERINGIIKNYYLIPYQPQSFKELKEMLTKAVYLYNNERPHKALNRLSPVEFEYKVAKGLLTKTWFINKKKKVTKKEKVNISIK